MYSAADQEWMSKALEQAQHSLYLSNPNPRVGCVIVREGKMIAQGHTQQVGGPHAEIQALADLRTNGLSAEGATVYVTLEPLNPLRFILLCKTPILWLQAEALSV
jgi:diaminohydroxyphosphoribosylaminopyrimidine deaminase/5-amino-6-(5-phosphoribosylamino)uracil reductase